MAKMWAGRFKKEVNSKVNDFNSSISFDKAMYKVDILGSIAHATMLGKQEIISKEEADLIVSGLNDILSDLDSGELEFDLNAEDIHMFIEEELTKRLGVTGKRLHTARSRNDQVALDIRMYLREEIDEIIDLVKQLCNTICNIAQENMYTVMPGYTHLQRAQPITFAHHIMAYAQMFVRDIDRLKDCYKRTNKMPLGSGALASTTYNIDRQLVCDLLGFDEVTQNSLDGVSDRDFCMELANDIAILMVHLSRFSEEIIMWCSWEFKFIELDDAYSTGSSIMPQKKNPDIAELVRGKSARAISNLNNLLCMMKGLPLAYNKDMQEDKEAIFDSVNTAKMCLENFIPMLETMTILKDNMKNASAKGFINATDCADYLVKKGLAFRDAYKITGQLVSYCIDNDKTLETLTLNEYKQYSEVFEEDVFDSIALITCVMERNVVGGPSPKQVKSQIENVKKTIE